jgi:hypothetical protein
MGSEKKKEKKEERKEKKKKKFGEHCSRALNS